MKKTEEHSDSVECFIEIQRKVLTVPDAYIRLLQDDSVSTEQKKRARKEMFDRVIKEPKMLVYRNEQSPIPNGLIQSNFFFELVEEHDGPDHSNNITDSSGEFIKYHTTNELTLDRLQEIVDEANSLSCMASVATYDVMNNILLSSEDNKIFVKKFKTMADEAVNNAGFLIAHMTGKGFDCMNLIEETEFTPKGIMELINMRLGYGNVCACRNHVSAACSGYLKDTNEYFVLVNSSVKNAREKKFNIKKAVKLLKRTKSLMRFFQTNERERYYLNYDDMVYLTFYSKEEKQIATFFEYNIRHMMQHDNLNDEEISMLVQSIAADNK